MNAATKATEHNHSHAQNRFAVIPTAERLDADAARKGRGITIAVLDSGFYPHPDLANRIVAFRDVVNPRAELDAAQPPQAWDWHGTQTSVTAAGNGFLSDGVYSGLASESLVALVKVSDRGRISDENIVSGLDWVIANADRYNIRVVSMSLGGDGEVSFRESLVDEAAERAVRAGLTLVVAAGNAGCTADHRPIPPANAPSVITVGGYDDNNELDNRELDAYCSSFGPTLDGLLKPEIIAPAIWVAAPILPGTEAYRRAEALSQLAAAPEYQLKKLAGELWREAGLPPSVQISELPELVAARLRESKIVATHYQHVDGTSFAAPIVASVVAQMLEANPKLTPAAVKNILIATADRSLGSGRLSLNQQGYGVLNARRAVEIAARETHTHTDCDFKPPRVEGGKLVFWHHDDAAISVAVAAEFNNWNPQATFFARHASGLWRAEIELPPPGSYQYKFVLNGKVWLDDPSNGLKLDDKHGGFNSVLNISE